MAAERVLVLEHGAADVTHAGLLLVGRDDVTLGAQLGAVGADQLTLVTVRHVLVEVALAREHLVTVVTGPLVLAFLGVIVPHVSIEVPEKRTYIIALTDERITILLDFFGANWTQSGLAATVLPFAMLQSYVGLEVLDLFESHVTLPTGEPLLRVIHCFRMHLLLVLQ